MLDEERLKQVIATILEVEASSIDENANTDTIKSWDSLRHMNMVLAVEDEFGVSIPDSEAATITSYPLIRLIVSELVGG
jgi:acyl carrier protein